MDRLTIWEVFLFSVPEAAVIISIAFGLAGVKFQPKKDFVYERTHWNHIVFYKAVGQ